MSETVVVDLCPGVGESDPPGDRLQRVMRHIEIQEECGEAGGRLETLVMLLVNEFGLFLGYTQAADRDADVEHMFEKVRFNLAVADRLGHDKVH